MIQQEQNFSRLASCDHEDQIEEGEQVQQPFFLEICSSYDKATGTGVILAQKVDTSLMLESIWAPILELASDDTSINLDGMLCSN